MKILGIYRGTLCILIVGSRIIIQASITEGNKDDLIEYGSAEVFENWQSVEKAAWGI